MVSHKIRVNDIDMGHDDILITLSNAESISEKSVQINKKKYNEHVASGRKLKFS